MILKKGSKSFWSAEFFALGGIVALFGHGIVLYIFFLTAWSNSDYSTMVYFDLYNEALVEFFFIPITLVWGLFGLVYFFRKCCVVDKGLVCDGDGLDDKVTG